jgi:hypothetical protein
MSGEQAKAVTPLNPQLYLAVIGLSIRILFSILLVWLFI